MKETEKNYIEIECPVESGIKLDTVWQVKAMLDRSLRKNQQMRGWVQAWRGRGATGSTVWIRCFAAGPGEQWRTIKDILREEGLLEEAVVYQHHPALKYRTQIWP